MRLSIIKVLEYYYFETSFIVFVYVHVHIHAGRGASTSLHLLQTIRSAMPPSLFQPVASPLICLIQSFRFPFFGRSRDAAGRRDVVVVVSVHNAKS